MQKIANQLKRHRKRSGMNQRQFAKWLGIAYSSYIHLEQGQTEGSTRTLSKINRKVKIVI